MIWSRIFKKRCTDRGLADPEGGQGRAYPSSEFVVTNTLAKWKKLEPNEIDFSQSFSQKVVSRSCYVFNSLPFGKTVQRYILLEVDKYT